MVVAVVLLAASDADDFVVCCCCCSCNKKYNCPRSAPRRRTRILWKDSKESSDSQDSMPRSRLGAWCDFEACTLTSGPFEASFFGILSPISLCNSIEKASCCGYNLQGRIARVNSLPSRPMTHHSWLLVATPNESTRYPGTFAIIHVVVITTTVLNFDVCCYCGHCCIVIILPPMPWFWPFWGTHLCFLAMHLSAFASNAGFWGSTPWPNCLEFHRGKLSHPKYPYDAPAHIVLFFHHLLMMVRET